MKLRRVISGGQTGADEAGLVVAKRFRLETGGTIPKGYRTLNGARPELGRLYGLVQHQSESYVPRTYQNVRDGDGTIRLAGDFGSRGEVCTLKAIERYKKPHLDVDLTDPRPPADLAAWLAEHAIAVLNVAGNAEQTFKGCFALACGWLSAAFFEAGLEMAVRDADVLRALNLDPSTMGVYQCSGAAVESLVIRRRAS